MDDFGHYSGVDFARRVAGHLGMGAVISGGTLTAASDRYDTSQLNEALSSELLAVWQRIGQRNRSLLSRSRDVTYPADTERMFVMDPVPPGETALTPPMPPWLGLWNIYDRESDTSYPPLANVAFESFAATGGTRWAIHNGALYVSEGAGRRGPGRELSLRIDYIPVPKRIDSTSNEARTDVPIQLHEPLALMSAVRLGVSLNSARVKQLGPYATAQMAEAVDEVARVVAQPVYTTWTRGPLVGRDSGRIF